MPNNIQYSKSPNETTAFVVQEGGQKNRAVLTAPQDTTTLELPDNPNSTKGYVTIDGKKHKVILTADISGNGGGGGGAVDSVNGKTGVVVLDATDVGAVPQYETMPTADASNVGEIAQYSGATAGSYTNGYFYQSIIALNVLSGTVEFNPASISGTTVTCSGADFANFVSAWGSGNITDIIKGTLTYDQSGGLLVFVGQDDTDTQVCTFQLYTQDYQDAGFTFTGTLQDGDVFAFTCTITETPVYDWTRIDVQPQPVIPDPLPSQTGNNGKFLSTNGTTASWETVGGLPDQTGNSGKFLTTDGSQASWGGALSLSGGTVTGEVNITKTSDDGRQMLRLLTGNLGGIGFRGKYIEVLTDNGGGNYSVSARYEVSAGGFAAMTGTKRLGEQFNPWGNFYINGNIVVVDSSYNTHTVNVPATAGTMVVAVPPTTPNTIWTLKATVDANGVSTVAWVQDV